MEKTKLLVIAIATVAIITAATTTSLSAARPAFAAVNCNPDQTVCSGGGKAQTQGETCTGLPVCHGGSGGRFTFSPDGDLTTVTGGAGLNGGTVVGGSGGSFVCDEATGCTQIAGGSGGRP